MTSKLRNWWPVGRVFGKIRTAIAVFRAYGLLGVIFVMQRKIWGVEFAAHNPQTLDGEINAARRKTTRYLADLHDNTVAHGPFKGLKLPRENWWGQLDVGGQILGTYERHVQEKIAELAQPDAVFVDIGSADGYFAIGAVKAGLFPRAVCFEISGRGREVLRKSAANNGVAEKIEILGEADVKSVIASTQNWPTGVMLCDIEGGEFWLLSKKFLKETSHMHIIVELHTRRFEDGLKKKSDLVDRAKIYFDVTILRRADIQISRFSELDPFNDNERMLAFSEGRGSAEDWLLLTPRRNA